MLAVFSIHSTLNFRMHWAARLRATWSAARGRRGAQGQERHAGRSPAGVPSPVSGILSATPESVTPESRNREGGALHEDTAGPRVTSGGPRSRRQEGPESERGLPEFPYQAHDPELERDIQIQGREWLEDARAAAKASRSVWSERLVERALADEAFKVQLFRFVDVFPMLGDPAHLCDVLNDYFSMPGLVLPRGMQVGLRATRMAKGAASRAIGHQIRSMAQNFIAGESVDGALPGLRAAWEKERAFSVDLLGEACVSQAEAEQYAERYLALIRELAARVTDWPSSERLEHDPFGALPRASVSIKLSSLDPRATSIDLDRGVERLVGVLTPILEEATQLGVFVNFDIEQFAIKELVLRTFERCCERFEFHAGIALQAYLRSAAADAERLIGWAQRHERVITVRLVKGAYWDYETIHAQQQGWPCPVWSSKAATDACFEDLVGRFIAAAPTTPGSGGVRLALGSHNVRSINCAVAHLERTSLPMSALELQMLYGMAEPLKEVAVARGLRLREYVPIGAMIPGMAYLVRRLLENTSNESWLKAGFLQGASNEILLRRPEPRAEPCAEGGVETREPAAALRPVSLRPGAAAICGGRPFASEPLRDFHDARQFDAFASAVSAATVPAAPVSVADIEPHLVRAEAAARGWAATSVVRRAEILVEAAAVLRGKRDEVAALVVAENGKCWADADGDVCEAIEFLEFYAREAVSLFEPCKLGSYVGELDEQRVEPRGVVAVIPPWNFPVAIPCGMTCAALVTGNVVLLKPAEQTNACARALADILWRAGVPRDVLQLVPGTGEEVGARLVRDPRVAMIAFTGSQEVGFDILRVAGQVVPEQREIKHVVCEMGGKNAIIVDATADLDEAVVGVRDSAFGFQGQKCSACSRVVVLEGVYQLFLERLIEATRALVIGDPRDPNTDVGPLIDAAALRKVLDYIEIGKQEGRLELACPVPKGLAEAVGKPYVGPHIFSAIGREHRLANEEIFGPVLSVMRVSDFDTALREANATRARLTGGVFSRTPSHLERARREFRVGNLYLNRGITGARVARQPFGGLGWSGVGAQAGGAGYLDQFVVHRSICENSMRRGFSPEL